MLANKLESAAKAVEPAYIEDVFSTYLYTGTNANQTITNNIDLANKGGLVWAKSRTVGTRNHFLYDTVRGATNALSSDLTSASQVISTGLTSFGATGFTLGSDNSTNSSPEPFASWTFRKQPKFFDIVTYTGNGSSITVNHNLGSVPGCIIIKNLSSPGSWLVWHRSLSGTSPRMFLDDTSAAASTLGVQSSTVNSTSFTYPWSYDTANGNGLQYVAYLFAHDAGGFGATGSENVISCGSFTTDSGGNTTSDVNLGYEPQWLLAKPSSGVGDWQLFDNMRGLPVDNGAGAGAKVLYPNTSAAEASTAGWNPTSTGFKLVGGAGGGAYTFIYIAIRRGPMKVPTDGTKVFAPYLSTGGGSSTTPDLISNFPVDSYYVRSRTSTDSWYWLDRLRGGQPYLNSTSTAAEANFSSGFNSQFAFMNGVYNSSLGVGYEGWLFRRAPGFFDEVCYTGTGSATTVTHNLGVAPELMIVKVRDQSIFDWVVYAAPLTATSSLRLNLTDASSTSSLPWNNTAPTSSVFTVNFWSNVNNSGSKYVAYLFASCPGVSKVGSYIGNGTSKTIDCGFTAGARFVLIKRTDNTGDWYVWDTARGIVSGNDPHLSMNTTVAEVTTDDTIDTDSTGFIVNQLSATNVNVSSATYIYLAIA